MGSGFKVTVDASGFKELGLALRALPAEIRAKELKRAVTAGAAVVAREARERAPVLSVPDKRREPGLLRRMIRGTGSRLRGNEAAAFVGVRRLTKKAMARINKGRGSNFKVGDAFYWKFIEFGTAKLAARPFLRPAFEAKKMAAIDAVRRSLASAFERQIRRLFKRVFR